MDDYLTNMFDAYLECALWSSLDSSRCDHCNKQNLDENGECQTPDCAGYGNNPTLDANYLPDDIASESLAEMLADCSAFRTDNAEDLANMDPRQAGHDFWLTRNGHGAGFWDRGLGKRGERLTEAAYVYGESDLYVGDDGKVYV